jgi:hypothetical protein
VALPSNSQTTDEFVSEGLGLGDGAETTDSDLLGVQFNRTLGEVEPLLNNSRQFADSASLLAQDVLGSGGHDDDLGFGRGDPDLDAGVAILGQLAGQELVEFGFENAVSDKLKSDATLQKCIQSLI